MEGALCAGVCILAMHSFTKSGTERLLEYIRTNREEFLWGYFHFEIKEKRHA